MLQDDYVPVNNAEELASALNAGNKIFALFYASWCPFCARFMPQFKKQATEKKGSFLLVQDDDELLCNKYSIKVFPTVLFFENGTVKARLDGVAGLGLQEAQLGEFIAACWKG